MTGRHHDWRHPMTNLLRREFRAGAAASAGALGVAAFAKAASFGNPDRPSSAVTPLAHLSSVRLDSVRRYRGQRRKSRT